MPVRRPAGGRRLLFPLLLLYWLSPAGHRPADAAGAPPTDRGAPAVLKGHTGPVYAVAFHPKDQTLASGSLDKTIRVWNLDDGKTAQEIKGHTDIVDTVRPGGGSG